MASRLDLHEQLKILLGSENVYYQPPESIKMSYPAIRYSKIRPNINYADNTIYTKRNCYEIIVISKKNDEPVIEELEKMELCSWDRHYISDNLHHDVLTLYY